MIKIIKFFLKHLRKVFYLPGKRFCRILCIGLQPERIVLMLTDRCNSRCVHCHIWQEKPSDEPLSPQEFEKIMSDPLFKNVKYVLCTGGEITLRQDLEAVVMSIHKALPCAVIQLSTNGLLAERMLSVVESALLKNIPLEIGVSLDGMGPEHDKIRGVEGNFKKADWLLRRLVALRDSARGKLVITAGIVVSDLTVDSICAVRDYVRDLNINLVEAWYNVSSFYKNASEDTKLRLKEKIVKIVNSQPPSIIKERWLGWLAGKSLKFSCFALQTFGVIKCNGDVVPCLNFWNSSCGNVRRSLPSEIWQSQQAKEVRKAVIRCSGCLNTWGAGWSLEDNYFPLIAFYVRHPELVLNRKKGTGN